MTSPFSAPYGPPVRTQVLLERHRCSTGHVVLAWVLAVLTGFYLLPWAVAATRGRRNVAAVALLDLLLGWTLVGWVVALVMALGTDRPVVVVQHLHAPWPAKPVQPVQRVQPVQPPQLVRAPQPVRAASSEPTVVDPLGYAPTEVLTAVLPVETRSRDQH